MRKGTDDLKKRHANLPSTEWPPGRPFTHLRRWCARVTVRGWSPGKRHTSQKCMQTHPFFPVPRPRRDAPLLPLLFATPRVAVARCPTTCSSPRSIGTPDNMAASGTRAFNLASAGSVAELQSMLSSGEVSASFVRQDGMYKSWTLLHVASSKGHATVVDLLLRAGADPRARNSGGKSAAQLALDKGHGALANALQQAEATGPQAPTLPRPPMQQQQQPIPPPMPAAAPPPRAPVGGSYASAAREPAHNSKEWWARETERRLAAAGMPSQHPAMLQQQQPPPPQPQPQQQHFAEGMDAQSYQAPPPSFHHPPPQPQMPPQQHHFAVAAAPPPPAFPAHQPPPPQPQPMLQAPHFAYAPPVAQQPSPQPQQPLPPPAPQPLQPQQLPPQPPPPSQLPQPPPSILSFAPPANPAAASPQPARPDAQAAATDDEAARAAAAGAVERLLQEGQQDDANKTTTPSRRRSCSQPVAPFVRASHNPTPPPTIPAWLSESKVHRGSYRPYAATRRVLC